MAESDGVVFHGRNGTRNGSCGRIGLPRKWFVALGGYDEAFEPVGIQDIDLLRRAEAAGLVRCRFTGGKTPVPNTRQQKVAQTNRGLSLRQMINGNSRQSEKNLADGHWVRNPRGWGQATVSINFGPPLYLPPIVPCRRPGADAPRELLPAANRRVRAAASPEEGR